MRNFKRAILTHGGSGSDPKDSDGPSLAAQAGMDILKLGQTPLNAVISAVRYLEDDPRFNAGFGSQFRADGTTIQMDASCMISTGAFGAVASIEGIQNPIEVASEVLLHSPHIIIMGGGARTFAVEQNIPLISINSSENREALSEGEHPLCDTVGAVAFDGNTFAAALSSGGLKGSAIGRVGDVPLPGCGLYCGPLGAIACTGDGEYIALKILSREIYSWLENDISPREAVSKALLLFDASVDIGLIILTKNEFASGARNGMAWSHITEAE